MYVTVIRLGTIFSSHFNIRFFFKKMKIHFAALFKSNSNEKFNQPSCYWHITPLPCDAERMICLNCYFRLTFNYTLTGEVFYFLQNWQIFYQFIMRKSEIWIYQLFKEQYLYFYALIIVRVVMRYTSVFGTRRNFLGYLFISSIRISASW